jgi:hypothetical protein
VSTSLSPDGNSLRCMPLTDITSSMNALYLAKSSALLLWRIAIHSATSGVI